MITLSVVFVLYLIADKGYADTNVNENNEEVLIPRPKLGRYVAELHGGHRGRYTPDDSGKYRHQHMPYDGGYGDRGEPYANDFRGFVEQRTQDYASNVDIVPPTPGTFMLGPKDHLRFMIDFNYNGTGWQIIQFDWLRDDDEQQHYKYVNENMLWDSTDPKVEAQPYNYEQPGDTAMEQQQYENDRKSQVHVEGAYDRAQNTYEVNYSNAPGNARIDKNSNIQDTIYDILEYIQNHILPTLSNERNSQ